MLSSRATWAGVREASAAVVLEEIRLDPPLSRAEVAPDHRDHPGGYRYYGHGAHHAGADSVRQLRRGPLMSQRRRAPSTP